MREDAYCSDTEFDAVQPRLLFRTRKNKDPEKQQHRDPLCETNFHDKLQRFEEMASSQVIPTYGFKRDKFQSASVRYNAPAKPNRPSGYQKSGMSGAKSGEYEDISKWMLDERSGTVPYADQKAALSFFQQSFSGNPRHHSTSGPPDQSATVRLSHLSNISSQLQENPPALPAKPIAQLESRRPPTVAPKPRPAPPPPVDNALLTNTPMSPAREKPPTSLMTRSVAEEELRKELDSLNQFLANQKTPEKVSTGDLGGNPFKAMSADLSGYSQPHSHYHQQSRISAVNNVMSKSESSAVADENSHPFFRSVTADSYGEVSMTNGSEQLLLSERFNFDFSPATGQSQQNRVANGHVTSRTNHVTQSGAERLQRNSASTILQKPQLAALSPSQKDGLQHSQSATTANKPPATPNGGGMQVVGSRTEGDKLIIRMRQRTRSQLGNTGSTQGGSAPGTPEQRLRTHSAQLSSPLLSPALPVVDTRPQQSAEQTHPTEQRQQHGAHLDSLERRHLLTNGSLLSGPHQPHHHLAAQQSTHHQQTTALSPAQKKPTPVLASSPASTEMPSSPAKSEDATKTLRYCLLQIEDQQNQLTLQMDQLRSRSELDQAVDKIESSYAERRERLEGQLSAAREHMQQEESQSRLRRNSDSSEDSSQRFKSDIDDIEFQLLELATHQEEETDKAERQATQASAWLRKLQQHYDSLELKRAQVLSSLAAQQQLSSPAKHDVKSKDSGFPDSVADSDGESDLDSKPGSSSGSGGQFKPRVNGGTHQGNRPMTRYLPQASSIFDLCAHIESAGHNHLACQHVSLTATAARGWLQKSSGRWHGWHKRWFVFDRVRRLLSYYPDNSETKAKAHISFQTIQDVYVDHKKPLLFCVKTLDKCFSLLAPSAEALRIWVDVIATGTEANTLYQS